MHQAIEAAPFPSSTNPSPVESSPKPQGPTVRSRSVVSSPTDRQSTTMPSVTEGFDGFHGRPAQSGTRQRTHSSRQPSEPVAGTTSGSPYPNVARGFGMPANYESRNRQYGSFDSSPSLPPLRGLRSLQERGHDRSDEHAFSTGGGYHPGHGSVSDPEAPTSFHPPAHSSYDLPYRPQVYPPLGGTSGLVPADYRRSEHPVPDAAHRPATFGSYSDLEYPPQLLNNPQYANYGLLGDATRRRRGNLPKHITDILKAWFQEHLDHPYPTEEDKRCLQSKTLLSIQQASASAIHFLTKKDDGLTWVDRLAIGSSTLADGTFQHCAQRKTARLNRSQIIDLLMKTNYLVLRKSQVCLPSRTLVERERLLGSDLLIGNESLFA